MNKILSKLPFNKWLLLFVFILCYLIVTFGRMAAWKEWTWNILFPDGAFFTFLEALFLFFIIEAVHKYFSQKRAENLYFSPSVIFFSFLVFFLVSNAFAYLVAFSFNNVALNFNHRVLILTNISRLINFALFGTIYLTYRYFTESQAYKEKLLSYDTKLSNSKIQNLKNQLNPHFLFNNLNVLDQLIAENQEKASDFLVDFAELYRYSLATSDKKLVTTADELDFAKKYFQIMQIKYEDTYSLHIKNNSNQNSFLPPLTLQLLLENVFNHNLSTPDTPIDISVVIDNQIIVSNNKSGKSQKKLPSGKSLKNLKEQYQILTQKPIIIEENQHSFTVKLPLILESEI